MELDDRDDPPPSLPPPTAVTSRRSIGKNKCSDTSMQVQLPALLENMTGEIAENMDFKNVSRRTPFFW